MKVWGGRKLSERLNKSLPSNQPYGESWELHDTAAVANGPFSGMNLRELARRCGSDLLGAGNDPADGFPLLAKFIDANDWLSIQVHPNDIQARALEAEPRGKTEAWVVLQADLGARLVIGVQRGITGQQLAEAIRENQLEKMLVYAEVKEGNVLYIPANTIHALGPGILIYEIQQSSDITYRLYDWGRLGLDEQPRELHIDKGTGVANLDSLPSVRQPESDLLVDGDYFRTWRHALKDDTFEVAPDGRFQALSCIGGWLRVEADGHEAIELRTGETGLIPACLDLFRISGHGVMLRSCQTSPPPK